MARSAYETLYKGLMNINESGCRPYGLASALIVIGVSAWYPDNNILAEGSIRHFHYRSWQPTLGPSVPCCYVDLRWPQLPAASSLRCHDLRSNWKRMFHHFLSFTRTAWNLYEVIHYIKKNIPINLRFHIWQPTKCDGHTDCHWSPNV